MIKLPNRLQFLFVVGPYVRAHGQSIIETIDKPIQAVCNWLQAALAVHTCLQGIRNAASQRCQQYPIYRLKILSQRLRICCKMFKILWTHTFKNWPQKTKSPLSHIGHKMFKTKKHAWSKCFLCVITHHLAAPRNLAEMKWQSLLFRDRVNSRMRNRGKPHSQSQLMRKQNRICRRSIRIHCAEFWNVFRSR